jgi:hypothetical protein
LWSTARHQIHLKKTATRSGPLLTGHALEVGARW